MQHKKIYITGIIAILAFNTMLLVYPNSPSNNFGFNVELKVYVNGQLKYDAPHDLLMPTAYDYVICKAFNDTDANGACYTGSGFNSYLINFVDNSADTAPQYYCASIRTSLTNLKNVFFSNEDCTMTAAWLSTDNGTPLTSLAYCPSAVITNGLAPIQVATSTHVSGGNSLVLTATWLATGTQTGIDKACLGLWNTHANHAMDSSGGTGAPWILTSDLFSPISVVSGQQIQVAWTISF